jgi:spore coat polysaccharide biosynthesis predicted glycosyltransferase SpsG
VAAVIFRCNASPTVGIGHVVRCRELGRILRGMGHRCIMVGPTQDYAKPGDEAIFESWVARPDWPSSEADATELVRLAKAAGATAAVMDDYRVDEDYQAVLLAGGLRWLQQFDAARSQLFWADCVVNASPYETLEMYRSRILKATGKGLFGPRYAVLSPELSQVQQRVAGRPVKEVLLTFGGGEDRGCVIFCLAALIDKTPADLRFLVVLGRANTKVREIEQWVGRHGSGRIDVHVDPPSISTLFARCDMAIMAGGTSTYEAAICGLPMILIAIAENQVRQGLGWERVGAAVFLGKVGEVEDVDLSGVVNEVLSSTERRTVMAKTGRSLVDGRGGLRLAACLMEACQ